jgi:hypothetical protein
MRHLVHKKNFNFFNDNIYNHEEFKNMIKYIDKTSTDDVLNIPHDFYIHEEEIMEYLFSQLDLSREYSQYLYGTVFCNRVEKHKDAASYNHTLLFVLQADYNSYIFVGKNRCKHIEKGDIIYLNNKIYHGLDIDGDFSKPFVALAFDFPYDIMRGVLHKLNLWRLNNGSLKSLS